MSRKGDTSDRRFVHSSTGQYGGRSFNVAVVGLSGTEKDKGCLGVGKSCLCNRFVRPQADEYNREHISILSQPDFSGPIVNNEHWLYWGETRKCTDEGFELTFSLIEQTEFVDDACFQPFRSGKSSEPYYRRCAATKLSSAEKLMYVCKNQLGIEKEYEQHYLPESRFSVDGFVCVFDVSEIQGRTIERQIELTGIILTHLLKTKKPVVLVTTKNDEAYEPYVKEAEKLVGRREYKGLIPLVETSAHENVNVDLAFWACVQRDWIKGGKSRLLSYNESFQRQRDRLELVNDAYITLIRSNITDFRIHWNNTYSNFAQSKDFIKYCDLFGQEQAQQTFKRHVKKLKEEYLCRKIDTYLRRLPKIFSQMLPDLESFGPDHDDWPTVQQNLQKHPLFNHNFVINDGGVTWHEVEDSTENRIPFDVLGTPESEKVYINHLNALQAENRLRSLRYQFSELLRETAIVPGQPLKEIRESFKDRECVEALSESEAKFIYDEYQKILQQDARDQLNELFLERAPLFLQFSSGKMVTQEDLLVISDQLAKDERWTILDLLPQDRQLSLIRHLGFLQWPIKEHCVSGPACVDVMTEIYNNSLTKRTFQHRNHHLNELEKQRIKLVVVGSSSYVVENLTTVIKAMCPTLQQQYQISYDVKVGSEEELSQACGMLPSRFQNNQSPGTAYLFVYSSRSTLEYLLKILDGPLLAQLQFGDIHQAGLPLAFLLACSNETNVKERSYLREEGTSRAQTLSSAFFDVTSSEPHARFKSDELLQALVYLSGIVLQQSELSTIHPSPFTSLGTIGAESLSIPEGALNPQIRLLISLMCSDPISPARFLKLLLGPPPSLMSSSQLQTNHLINFYPVSSHSFVADVGFLLVLNEADDASNLPENIPTCYVEFVVSSYHSSYAHFKDELFYGNILVYWSKRQASFSNMSALASITGPMVPIQILALVENDPRPSKLSHQLVAKGQELAEKLRAHFRVSTLSPDIGRCISSFLNFTLQNKHHIEKGLHISASPSVDLTDPNHLDPANVVTHQHSSCSPVHSTINDECYDPNMDEHFEDLHFDSAKFSSEGIYERLSCEIPDAGGRGLQHPPKGSTSRQPLNDSSFSNEFSSLVTRNEAAQPGSSLFDSTTPSTTTTRTPNNAQNQEEHLLKPSELRQRHRLNNNHYFNLQSYPSVDSLDRIYNTHETCSPLASSFYSNHPHNQPSNISQMPPHYVYRPYVHHQQQQQQQLGYVDSFDQSTPPPRPASSAHVMVPGQHHPHHQPPPYSRIAISPPPAYKMQSYEDVFDPSPLASDSYFVGQDFPPEPSTLAYYQRKYYPHHYQLDRETFRGVPNPNSSNFHPYPGLNENYQLGSTTMAFDDSGLMGPTSEVVHPSFHHGGNSSRNFRNSPLVYATTGRNHNHLHKLPNYMFSRSSPYSYHQSGSPFSRNYMNFDSHSLSKSPPESIIGGSFSGQQPTSSSTTNRLMGKQKKKTKKKSQQQLKSRSLSQRRAFVVSSSMSNEADEEGDGDDDDDEEQNVGDSIENKDKPKSSLFRLRRKKIKDKLSSSETSSKAENMNTENDEKEILERMVKKQQNDSQQPTNKTPMDSISIQSMIKPNEISESESEVVKEDDDEQEEEIDDITLSSSNHSAEDKLAAAADKYAVSSGWAYHQKRNNHNHGNQNKSSSSPTNQIQQSSSISDQQQWPPNSSSNSINEKSKAPGKLDLKRFNNLSDAIGRLNLNSPLGPTQVNHQPMIFDYHQQSENEIGDSLISKRVATRPGGRLKTAGARQHTMKNVDSESDNNNSDSQKNDTMLTMASDMPPPIFSQINNNGLKPSIGASIGQKRLGQKKSRLIATPVPVAPPRLPSNVVVTPTGVGKSFLSTLAGASSFDDSQHEEFVTTPSDISERSSFSQNEKTFNSKFSSVKNFLLEKSSRDDLPLRTAKLIGNNRPQFSKLLSLQLDTITSNSPDTAFFNELDSKRIGEMDTVGYDDNDDEGDYDDDDHDGRNKETTDLGCDGETNDNDKNTKFLKSKSLGTFSELNSSQSSQVAVSTDKKSARKAEKLEKKRAKEKDRKNRKNSKESHNSQNNNNKSRNSKKDSANNKNGGFLNNNNANENNGSNGQQQNATSLDEFAQPNGNAVPLFIEKCTRFIEQEGLDMEGIYRVPGNRAHVDALWLKFEENPEITIADLDIQVNAVATGLKDFFLKRLPSIFPPDSMTEIATLAKHYTDTGQLDEIKEFLHSLPESNFEIIKHMITHFVKITEKSDVNSMDSKNLAICWWPTLLQFEFNDMYVFEQKRPHLMNFVQIMIESCQDLFGTYLNLMSVDNQSIDELKSL